jgi:hypothetical protein
LALTQNENGNFIVVGYRIVEPGRTVSLVDRPPNSGENFINTLFIDKAEVPINYGEAPYTGIFRPEDSLGIFNGMDPNGDWILGIIDHSLKKTLKRAKRYWAAGGSDFLWKEDPQLVSYL